MIKRIAFVALVLTLSLGGCNRPAPQTSTPTQTAVAESQVADREFAALSKAWLDGSLALAPVSATQIGDHRFDRELEDLSVDGRAKSLAFTEKMLAQLQAIDRSQLSRENQVDAVILLNQLQYDVWTQTKLQSWAWDPQIYSGLAGGAIYGLMAREFAPLPERMMSAQARMEKIPTLFATMRGNLDLARVPKTHAETVAKQNPGVIGVVDEFIVPHLDQLDAASRSKMDASIAALRKAVAEHQIWLDQTLVPNAKGDFRLGAALYDEKLAFALNSKLTRAEIRERAETEITRVRARMYTLATGVLATQKNAPKTQETPPATPDAKQEQAVIEAALELAYVDQPARDKVVEVATDLTSKATEFVRQKDLISLPDAKVKIILMPEFQRGFSVAYCDSPGPLDNHLDTFYAVSPIPDDWTETQTNSFLREYNNRSIDELSVHEAMPGHYVQTWHSNKHPSVLRAVLSSGSFVEGWAVYAERMMVEAGYRDHDPLYELIQLKWYLRAVANAILDQAIHVDGMGREDAMRLMTETTFQQEREAAGKWVRAQLSSTQLPTYFVGAQEHFDLRREMETREGKNFNLKTYHDKVLSYGSPPGRLLRQLILNEAIQ